MGAGNNKLAQAPGRVVVLGFGSVAQGTLPLLLRHLGLQPSGLRIISRSPDRTGIAAGHGVEFIAQPLTAENYEAVLERHTAPGDFLLNLSVDVSSLALIRHCRR